MSSFTAWVWVGSVTMSMTSSTSITSMSGVVLTSHNASSVPPWETFIDMLLLSRQLTATPFGSVRKATLEDARRLDGVQHARHLLVARVAVGLQVQLGLRHLPRTLEQLLD